VGKRLLVRPVIAHVDELARQRAMPVAQRLAEHILPTCDHRGEQRLAVPLDRAVAVAWQLAVALVVEPFAPVLAGPGVHLALDKRGRGPGRAGLWHGRRGRGW